MNVKLPVTGEDKAYVWALPLVSSAKASNARAVILRGLFVFIELRSRVAIVSDGFWMVKHKQAYEAYAILCNEQMSRVNEQGGFRGWRSSSASVAFQCHQPGAVGRVRRSNAAGQVCAAGLSAYSRKRGQEPALIRGRDFHQDHAVAWDRGLELVLELADILLPPKIAYQQSVAVLTQGEQQMSSVFGSGAGH